MKITEKDKKREQIVQKFVNTYKKPEYIDDIIIQFIPGGLSTYFLIKFIVNNKFEGKKTNRWMNNLISDINQNTPYYIASAQILFEK